MVKSILQSELKASRRLLRQLAQRDGAILVNGKSAYLTARVKQGDTVHVTLPTETTQVALESLVLDIRYEDDEIVVVNKAPGILTHPTAREKTGSLVGGLLGYFQEHESDAVPHSVHRLDRDTSGLIMFAKHAHAHHLFDIALRKGDIHRTYCALVHLDAIPSDLRAWNTITLPIAQDPRKPSRRVISADGQAAVTHYRIVARVGTIGVAQIVLETGRTHQIRLHFASSGMPLVADTDYNVWHTPEEVLRRSSHSADTNVPVLSRQALHAMQLGWLHPVSRAVHIVEAEPPEDMQQFWRALGGESSIWEEILHDSSGLEIVHLADESSVNRSS